MTWTNDVTYFLFFILIFNNNKITLFNNVILGKKVYVFTEPQLNVHVKVPDEKTPCFNIKLET